MFCKECGTQIKEGAKFCPKCGSKVGGSTAGIAIPSVIPQYVPQTPYQQMVSPAPGKNGWIILGLSIVDLAWILIWESIAVVSIIKDPEILPSSFLMVLVFPLIHAITTHVLLLKEHIKMLKILTITGFVLFPGSEIIWLIVFADAIQQQYAIVQGTSGLIIGIIAIFIAPVYSLFFAIYTLVISTKLSKG
jgi:hypothetical protein